MTGSSDHGFNSHQDLQEEMTSVVTSDGTCDAFLVRPRGDLPNGKSHPGVLFLMDAFGLRKATQDMARLIASHGYRVLLPNLFYRMRPAPIVDAQFPLDRESFGAVLAKIRPFFSSLPPALALKDIAAYLDFLDQGARPSSAPARLTGYCMGGSLAIRAAAAYPDRVCAVASFHAGNLATDAADSPYKLFSQIKARIYIAHADHDQSMPPEQIARVHTALTQSGKANAHSELYSGAEHGFTMKDLPAYNETADQRHWKNLFGLFEESASPLNLK